MRIDNLTPMTTYANESTFLTPGAPERLPQRLRWDGGTVRQSAATGATEQEMEPMGPEVARNMRNQRP